MAKNVKSGPIIDTGHVGGFCRLKLDDGWVQPLGVGGGDIYHLEWSQLMNRPHPYNKHQWRKPDPWIKPSE